MGEEVQEAPFFLQSRKRVSLGPVAGDLRPAAVLGKGAKRERAGEKRTGRGKES